MAVTSPDPRTHQPAGPPSPAYPAPAQPPAGPPPPGYGPPYAPQPWPVQPAPPAKKRQVGLLVAAGVVAALVLVAVGATLAVITLKGRGSSTPGSSAPGGGVPMTVNGYLGLTQTVGGWMNIDGTTCTGMGGYDDIGAGTQVVITDEAGKVIATGQLSGGVIYDPGYEVKRCRFPFTVGPVPRGHQFYGIEVSHRGRIQYTQAQLMNKPELTLGG